MLREEARPMIELYSENNTEIKKLMNTKNRSAAYVANALIGEALTQRKLLKTGTLEL